MATHRTSTQKPARLAPPAPSRARASRYHSNPPNPQNLCPAPAHPPSRMPGAAFPLQRPCIQILLNPIHPPPSPEPLSTLLYTLSTPHPLHLTRYTLHHSVHPLYTCTPAPPTHPRTHDPSPPPAESAYPDPAQPCRQHTRLQGGNCRRECQVRSAPLGRRGWGFAGSVTVTPQPAHSSAVRLGDSLREGQCPPQA